MSNMGLNQTMNAVSAGKRTPLTLPLLTATSFPGSLFSASLSHWKKDPGCGCSRYHPESGWQKNLLGGGMAQYFVW